MEMLVNFAPPPEGARMTWDPDDGRARLMALRLGLLEDMMRRLDGMAALGARSAIGMRRDGDRLVAVLVWAGHEDNADGVGNGWGVLTISPATDETAWYLYRLTRALVPTGQTWMLKDDGGGPWKN